MKKVIRIIAAFLCVLFSSSFLCVPADGAEPPEITSVRSAILFNVENGTVLYSLREDEAVYPASSVKLMTAVLAYRALKNRMSEVITVTPEMIAGASGYRIGLEAGEQITVEAMFYAMLLRGSNDSAYALAYLTSGSVSAFVDAMNAYAKQIGMSNTLYLNPSGLHEPQMVTTVSDTLKIACEFAKEEALLTMSSVVKYVIPANNKSTQRTVYNRNGVVSKYQDTKYFYEYAKGMNYGSTEESGCTCTSMASHNGLTYISVVIGGEEDPVSNTDFAMKTVNALLRYGVNGFAYTEVIDIEKPICEMPVTLSAQTDFVMLYPKNGLVAYLPSDIDVNESIKTSYRLTYNSLEAPVTKGTCVGYLNVYYGEEQIGSVELITADDVERNSFLHLLQSIKAYSNSRFFRATAISAVVLTVLYVFASAAIRRKRSKRTRRYKF